MSLIDFFKRNNAIKGTIMPNGEMTTLEMWYQNQHYFIVTGVYQKKGDKLIQVNPADIFSECETFRSILSTKDRELMLRLVKNNFSIEDLAEIK